MDAVKEAVLEQKIDDLTLRFEQAEERNCEEHREICAEIRTETRDLRADIGDLRGEIHHLSRTIALGFASIAASVLGAVAAAFIANAV